MSVEKKTTTENNILSYIDYLELFINTEFINQSENIVFF